MNIVVLYEGNIETSKPNSGPSSSSLFSSSLKQLVLERSTCMQLWCKGGAAVASHACQAHGVTLGECPRDVQGVVRRIVAMALRHRACLHGCTDDVFMERGGSRLLLLAWLMSARNPRRGLLVSLSGPSSSSMFHEIAATLDTFRSLVGCFLSMVCCAIQLGSCRLYRDRS
jgi:hypothetical protein